MGCSINTLDKLAVFPRFTTKRSLSRFLVKQEIFKGILGINGSVVECGVFTVQAYLHGPSV